MSKPTKTKREKTFKAPTGHRGARKTPQDPITLLLQRRGLYTRFKAVKCNRYAGTEATFGSFDPRQARLNREAGLC